MKVVNLTLKVTVALHQHNMPGRKGFGSGVRPNHWIPGRDYAFAGQIDFDDRKWLEPGESCNATIDCMIPEQDLNSFNTGFAWHICEANKIVGYAKVL